MADLTVTLIQCDPAWEDIDANLALFEARISEITRPTDLIVLPEMFSTGFSLHARLLAEPVSGRAVSWMRRLAVQTRATIVG
ncbi:MAG: nitrilase family protein, partial [Desulfatitalea sp.]|nr:nitrilase family protein [Desulfatitalea sp.]NNK00414.1 nitrilase family protein [Desulfatitalea sp.]